MRNRILPAASAALVLGVWLAAATPQGAQVRAGAARGAGVPAPRQARGALSESKGADVEQEKWVKTTLAKMTLDEQVGQLIVTSCQSDFTSSDSETYDALVSLVHEVHLGGLHLFGGSQPVPGVLLNAGYSSVRLGNAMDAASLLNRLQAIAPIPLMNTADFEAGVGFRIAGATAFPRAMAFGAAGDERLAYEAGRITGVEGRAIGVHVNFAPVVDVNNNPRNPVINTRSFGEDPAAVGKLAAAYVRGLQAGGMLATLKHFPGHGDTDVDSHIGLPIIKQPRERLDRVELPPYRDGFAAGAAAVMTTHIEMPALDPAENTPATISRPIVTGLLRDELKFDGLIYTDSMSMQGVTDLYGPGDAAVRAFKAGNDVVLHSPDDREAFKAIKAAVERGEIDRAQVAASVERILRAKARLLLYRTRAVNLEAIPTIVGTRASRAVAEEASRRSLTLIRDDRNQVPLRLSPDAKVLYLSVLDYPSGWGIAAPSRTFIPELRQRWSNVTAVELSDRSSRDEVDLVRATAARYDAVIAGVFVRAASASGRMDLSELPANLLRDLAAVTEKTGAPYVVVLFGSPYVALALPGVPALLLTYDFYDLAERSAVRALAGEAPIGGRLPIGLPGLFDAGHGLTREAIAAGGR